MEIYFKEEHEIFRKTIQSFIEKEILPLVDEAEEKEKFPVELFPKMGSQGFLCIRVPKTYGGRDGDKIMECIAIEELTKGSSGITSAFTTHGGLATDPILRFGSEDQKQRYLVPAVKGEKIGAFGLTEPDAGSDAASLRATAEKRLGGYLINGTKTFITNGPICHYVIVAAYTDVTKKGSGINLFIVDRENPGFSVVKKLTKLGHRSTETGELSFDDCWVPKEQMIGDQEGGGFNQIEYTLRSGRISTGARCIGLARSILEESMYYVRNAKKQGRMVGRSQSVRFSLAEMAMYLDVMKAITYRCAWLYDCGKVTMKDAAIVKLFCTETLCKMAYDGLRLQGGEAYLNSNLMQRLLRDSRLHRIPEGTSEIQHLLIFNELGI
ncbi:MAG: acyl-CoA dehydrogenase family protein [Syntrophaceae bacterium]|nr:acyl-CoA dehydrogenase family protein [Syntrophaceae bacterium]